MKELILENVKASEDTHQVVVEGFKADGNIIKEISLDEDTTLLVSQNVDLAESLIVVHTKDGNTTTSATPYPTKIIKESWEDISRRRASQLLG